MYAKMKPYIMEIVFNLPHFYHIETISQQGMDFKSKKGAIVIMNKKVVSLAVAAMLTIGSSVSVNAACIKGVSSRDCDSSLKTSASRDNSTSLKTSSSRDNGTSLKTSASRDNGTSLKTSASRNDSNSLKGSANRDTNC